MELSPGLQMQRFTQNGNGMTRLGSTDRLAEKKIGTSMVQVVRLMLAAAQGEMREEDYVK